MANILIVDDSPDVLKLVGRFFEAKGHNVSTAANGAEGVEKASMGLPDIILMDINMPGGNGFETTRRIKQIPSLKATTVFALTAETSTANRDAIHEAGCEIIIAKPIDFPKMLRQVEGRLAGA